MIFQFPENFFWGSATSAHQVEGGNVNDWSEWEKNNAIRLAGEASCRWQIWQQKKFPEIFNRENYLSGQACDHYHLYEQDFDIAKLLGHKAHRFSIEWSRIEQEKGKFNEQEIEHYQRVIVALSERNIEPFVSLWHWTIPLWLRDLGGWENKKTVDFFIHFADKMVRTLKGVRFWVVLNEPEIYASDSYLKGLWPPQKKNLFSYLKVIKNLIRAHQSSFELIKKINPSAQVGIAKNNIYFEAYQNKLVNRFLKKFIDRWWNFYFLNQINNYQDFIGLNHYFHNRINYGFNKNENKIISDLGWELYPEAIYFALMDLKKYHKPIYITENGLADIQDEKREWFIKETLKNTHKAIQGGCDVRGYFYWSLLDNFEWNKGFWPRFGLVEINRQTQKRKIRKSAEIYAEICRNNGF